MTCNKTNCQSSISLVEMLKICLTTTNKILKLLKEIETTKSVGFGYHFLLQLFQTGAHVLCVPLSTALMNRLLQVVFRMRLKLLYLLHFLRVFPKLLKSLIRSDLITFPNWYQKVVKKFLETDMNNFYPLFFPLIDGNVANDLS